MSGVKGRSGRPRLSAEEHRLRGTYRADRHAEPEATASIEPSPGPGPPPGLDKAGRGFWAVFAPLLVSANALTPADVQTLADYCRACVAVEDRGRRLERAFRKRPIVNQTVRMLDAQVRGWIERKTKLAAELGLTAVSRTRVGWSGHHQVIDRQEKPLSELARLQAEATHLRKPVKVK